MSDFLSKFKRVPPATLVLLCLNIIVFVAMIFLPSDITETAYALGSVSFASLAMGMWWTLLTSMFLHSGMLHIVCNMVSLYYLGVMCEKVFGTAKFILLYFISGIFGGLVFVASNYLAGNPFAAAVGASGAIFGLFGAYGYLLIRERKQNKMFAVPVSKADIQSYIFFLVANLMIGLSPGSGIANEAHIGGMICGFIISAIMYSIIVRKMPNQRNYRGSVSNPKFPQSNHPRYDNDRCNSDPTKSQFQ